MKPKPLELIGVIILFAALLFTCDRASRAFGQDFRIYTATECDSCSTPDLYHGTTDDGIEWGHDWSEGYIHVCSPQHCSDPNYNRPERWEWQTRHDGIGYRPFWAGGFPGCWYVVDDIAGDILCQIGYAAGGHGGSLRGAFRLLASCGDRLLRLMPIDRHDYLRAKEPHPRREPDSQRNACAE